MGEINFRDAIAPLKHSLEKLILHVPSMKWDENKIFTLWQHNNLKEILIDPRALVHPSTRNPEALADALPPSLAELDLYYHPDPIQGREQLYNQVILLMQLKRKSHPALRRFSVASQWLSPEESKGSETDGTVSTDLRSECVDARIEFGVPPPKLVEYRNLLKRVSTHPQMARSINAIRETRWKLESREDMSSNEESSNSDSDDPKSSAEALWRHEGECSGSPGGSQMKCRMQS